MLIYDIEILKAIPPRSGELEEGIEYCAGWDDKENMGVACIGAYDVVQGRYRVFTQGNFSEFIDLAAKRFVVGFNSIAFDDVICRHEGIPATTRWDLLQETWVAAGLDRTFSYPSHIGFGLDALAKANGLSGKTGWGGSAPVDWQRGYYGRTIDYCLEDVRQTCLLVNEAMCTGYLADPRNPGQDLTLNVEPLLEAAREWKWGNE